MDPRASGRDGTAPESLSAPLSGDILASGADHEAPGVYRAPERLPEPETRLWGFGEVWTEDGVIHHRLWEPKEG